MPLTNPKRFLVDVYACKICLTAVKFLEKKVPVLVFSL